MDRKNIFLTVYKNRFLFLICMMLILGTFFGTCVLKIIPENIAENLFRFIAKSSLDFKGIFINSFSFPFIVLIGIYLSGTGILGSFTVPAILFVNGFFFGFENALNYKFSGMNYIINSVIVFFTLVIFLNFMIIILSENSIYCSKQLTDYINGKNTEKSHYNTKKITVKFIIFTVIFAVVSLISSYFYKFIQPIL